MLHRGRSKFIYFFLTRKGVQRNLSSPVFFLWSMPGVFSSSGWVTGYHINVGLHGSKTVENRKLKKYIGYGKVDKHRQRVESNCSTGCPWACSLSLWGIQRWLTIQQSLQGKAILTCKTMGMSNIHGCLETRLHAQSHRSKITAPAHEKMLKISSH